MNKGWLKLYKEQGAANFMTESPQNPQAKLPFLVIMADYANLDDLAFDLK